MVITVYVRSTKTIRKKVYDLVWYLYIPLQRKERKEENGHAISTAILSVRRDGHEAYLTGVKDRVLKLTLN